MWSSRVLNCIGIDSQLMDLPEEKRIAVFGSEHLGV
jgi:hypothetical protein